MLNLCCVRILGPGRALEVPWTASNDPSATGDPPGLSRSLSLHPAVGVSTLGSREHSQGMQRAATEGADPSLPAGGSRQAWVGAIGHGSHAWPCETFPRGPCLSRPPRGQSSFPTSPGGHCVSGDRSGRSRRPREASRAPPIWIRSLVQHLPMFWIHQKQNKTIC